MTVIKQTTEPISLINAIERLISIVKEENDVLRRNEVVTHAGFTERKTQALRELLAVQRSNLTGVNDESVRLIAGRLSKALSENARLLKVHISAVGEISDTIINSLREAESDGTYGRSRGSFRS